MRQLNHKNVVELIDFKETKDHYFIVLELIPGGELFHQIVRLTYFSEDLARHVIVQVAEAVRYLHEVAGVVHRDIKPENLLFYPIDFIPSKNKTIRKGEDESKEDEGQFVPGLGAGGIGVIKLADFGLSKVIWDSKTMTPCGTVGYTAPEIVKDERYSKSVDMWALGCVLYTVLCGFPPFYDESIEVLTEKVAKGQYTFLSPWWDEISAGAKDLVSHLLTVDPDSRYTIDQFLQHPWITGATSRHAGPAAVAAAATASTGIVGSTGNSLGVIPEIKFTGSNNSVGTATTDITMINAVPERSQAASASTKEFPTPVVATLKEVFDVSNAVHRMEEENARNNRWKGRFQDNLLEEEEEEEEEEDDTAGHGSVTHNEYTMDVEPAYNDPSLDGVEQKLQRVSVSKAVPISTTSSKTKASHAVPRSSRKPHNHQHHHGPLATGGLFELHLEGATLIERRKRAGKQPPITHSLVT
ncbi:serine/threonine protein kinase RCK2 [Sugiyamaella lignohabitans]|uniref:Serine/threonine protein kinase RCK2 n=1 Tax=Sugiyamaella lignohabitans TaxID=796027 RepID=A0A167EWY8_9ASCO|nr:serine/threonine protein kinase RCK2 [Sugiyamaella lignohabitans]ANB14555.1 serine/threonine protein kinase RCK2 [Sugiyamaella lignohabitans]